MPQSPLRIGIDCRFASEFAGLGTYTREIVSALMSRKDEFLYTFFVRSKNESWIQSLPKPPAMIIEAPFPHYSFAEQTQFSAALKRSGIQLLFSPQFNVPLFCPVPFLCTVHDLILHKFPNNASPLKRLAYRMLMRSSVKRARAIVTISNFTKADIEHAYGANIAKKTIVIYPGIHSRFQRVEQSQSISIANLYGLPGKFLIYVGNAKQHKNVQMLIDAFVQLNEPDLLLVLVVSGKEKSALRLADNVRLISDVKTDDLPALYSAAAGCVTASLYEGFGLPILEAMACGCPAMATNRGSLPEVTGGHATIVEPTVEALTDGMKRLLSAQLSDEGMAWAKKFRWEESAEKLTKVFQS